MIRDSLIVVGLLSMCAGMFALGYNKAEQDYRAQVDDLATRSEAVISGFSSLIDDVNGRFSSSQINEIKKYGCVREAPQGVACIEGPK